MKPEFSGVCKLCDRTSTLEKSHAIPRSIFKQAKKGSGQLVELRNDPKFKPRNANLDPKEYLLCKSCELFLSVEYEKNSLQYLKEMDNFEIGLNQTKVLKIDYDRFYLFLISIIWRASISKKPFYKNIDLTEVMENLLKYCIKNKKIQWDLDVNLDQIMPISMVKLKDSKNVFNSKMLKTVIMPFHHECDKSNRTHQFQVSFDGYLFIYWFKPPGDRLSFKPFVPPEMLKKAPYMMNHIDLWELSAYADPFNATIDYSSNN